MECHLSEILVDTNSMKFNFRVSVEKMLKWEAITLAIAFALGTIFPASRDFTLTLTGICVAHIPIYAPVGIVNGFNFIMYDAPDESPWKIYHYLAIFFATAIGAALLGVLTEFSDTLRALF